VTTYDHLGQKISETDQAGKTASFEYDALGRLVEVTDALGQETRYTYDEMGNRVSQTDAKDHTTGFEYDTRGRLIRRELPLGRAETMSYDAGGNLKSRTDFNGATVQYEYDDNDRLTSRRYPDGTSVLFTYTPTGKRASVVDGRGTTVYQYDLRDRLLSLSYPGGRKLSYAYDGAGNRTSLSSMLGTTVLTTEYSYDGVGRLETVTDPQGHLYTHTYDANGNRASVAYPNGIRTTYAYDRLNRLTALTVSKTAGTILQSFAYTLGAAGNRVRIDENDGSVRSYEYDDLYRLTRESVTGTAPYENAFDYDPVGNRLSQTKTDGSGTVLYDYDERDRLLSDGSATYTWDDNGQLKIKSSADGATYVWNLDGRLTQVLKVDGTVITHAYDADGNRVRTEITPTNGPPTVTEFLVDPSDELSQVVADTDGLGNVTAYYVRGDDLLAVLRPTGVRFFHADGLGSIRLLTDELGAITDTYTFSAFGELLEHAGSDPNAYLFAGEQLDPNSGFYYLRARWMDTGAGRFISVDPLNGRPFEPLTLHKYLYANADPANRIDPTGLESLINQVNTMAFETQLASRAIFAQLRATFARGAATGGPIGAAIGKLFYDLGKVAERAAGQILSLHPRVIIDTGVRFGNRVLDFVARVGDDVAIIESKYSLPIAEGESLTRLVGQVNQAVSSGAGQVVLWSLKDPTMAQLRLTFQALGATAQRVQFVSGVEGLFRWMQLYFGRF
jgi:RHS repeat-associated protein